jgi:hypothetical protein
MLTLWCYVGMLFAHVLAQQPQQQCTCAQLTDCTSCIVGGNVLSLPLHLLQQPQGSLPTAVQVANSYNTAELFASITPDLGAVVPCNITCLWNKQKKSCADFSIAKLPSFQPIANFVTPYIFTLPVLQFDLFTRFAASRSCQDDLGKHSSNCEPTPAHSCTQTDAGRVVVGAITFPPYTLTPNTSSSCYGPCSPYSQ